jgi:hypothetical protein
MLRFFLHSTLIVIGIMLCAACGGFCRAQELPSSPIPVVGGANQSSAESVKPLVQPWNPPNNTVPVPGPVLPPPLIAPPSYVPYPDQSAPLLVRDPLLDRPHLSPGWFGALELNLLVPHIKNRLQAELQVDGFEPNLVHLPTAQLEWTGSPRLELGYRFCDDWGEFLAVYRFLVTDGGEILRGFDLDGSDGVLKSRLSINAIDFDYRSRQYNLDRHWDLNWRLGARLATTFFDSRAEAFFLEQRTSDHFIGAGPHAGLDFWRSFDWPGLGLFARVEGATLVGRVSQGFEEVVTDENGNSTGTAAHISTTRAVPIVEAEIGLGWNTCWRHHTSRLAIGYEFERWWSVGDAAASKADITAQGVFFRAEFGF